MAELPDLLPEADVALVHLPGMNTPFFREPSVQAFAEAFDQVLERLSPRNVVVLGASVGGLVALAMRHPAIRGLVLMDTALSMGLWPLRNLVAPTTHPRAVEWYEAILGFSSRRDGPGRDYGHLLDGVDVPVLALIGDVPLGEPRSIATKAPSLVTPADRARYEEHPGVQVITAWGCGHNLWRDNPALVLAAVRAAM
jgi:pimeloyl-ACP methyl ester carboxylesterase